MNRKLISSQPLHEDPEDLEHVDYYQNRDRRVTFDDEGEEQKDRPEDSSDIQERENWQDRNQPMDQGQISRKTTKRYHQLQVIDEDTEHFKTRLDDLINKFRAETLSEFMSIKRSLLQEQTENIENETRKYTRLLETRTNELDRTKEALGKKVKELERAEVITHVVADWSGRARIKKRNILLLSKCFSAFKMNKERQDNKHKANKMTEMIYKKKCIGKIFGAWRSLHTTHVEEKNKGEFDSTLNRELSELAAKYNKEIDMLNGRLNEALSSLNESQQNKEEMQENLKKAFMRGVCAMNFEAMSILKPGYAGDVEQAPTDQQVFDQQVEKMRQGDPRYHSLVLNPLDNKTNYGEQREEEGEVQREGYATSSPKKNIVFYQNPKLESKEMRWRDAPIVGASHGNEKKAAYKESIMRPSSYMGKVEDKENAGESNQRDYYERQYETIGHQNKEDEGRVIKVDHGKSYGATAGGGGTAGKQVKGQEKTVSANTNKASQLRTQIGKGKK